jgi:ABC-type uncharacterized transport system fused permease/ATPase subunit
MMISMCQVIGLLLTQLLMGPVVKAVFHLSQREGTFRFFHGRLRAFCECVTFYGGEQKESADSTRLFSLVYTASKTLINKTVPLFW